MGELISQYEAVSANFLDNVGAMIGIALIGFGIAALILWKGKKITYNYRLLLAMLFFFLGTISLGNGFFVRVSRGPLANFEIHESGLVTGRGTFSFKDLRDAYIYTDKQTSIIDPGSVKRQMRVMILEMDDGSRYSFTERNYPIEQIIEDVQDAFASFREKNN